jgi:hypothetical protein
MSIINDALKKAQISIKKTDKPPEKKPEPKSEPSTSNVYEKLYQKQESAVKGQQEGKTADKKSPGLRSAKKWVKTFAMVIISLAILSGSFYFLSRYKPVKDFLSSLRKIPASRAYLPKQAPKRRSYKPGELVLNGTSLIDGKRVALINDEIYQVGEIINGKKITSINLNKIELQDDEKIITLRVH